MTRPLISVLTLALLAGCQSTGGSSDDTDISLAEVPPIVIAAGQQAVPGIRFSEADLETEDGQQVYELEGTRDGVDYEIEITPEGKVLEVEEQAAEESESESESDDA